jgi:aspartyl-tRNA(Asn)/glutamyl-tRNA(Gln) amidotransferase subunit A
VPVTIKDNAFFSGFPTTNGSLSFREFVPSTNAEIVDLLLGAGCVPLGKTNLHEHALGATSTSALGGPIRNPADSSRISGGSSGGSAVSVAASKGPLVSVGSDTGGSVRIPAALCGVCGFKPSQGLLSTDGVFPLSPSLDHVGLLTKTVSDMSIAFRAITGPGAPAKERPVLGVPTRYFTEDMDETVSKDFMGVLDTLRRSEGFDVRDVKTEESYARYSRARATIMCREAAWFYEDLLRSPRSRRTMHSDVLALMDGGRRTGMIRYMSSMGVRADSIRSMSRLLDGIDALIMPTCLIVAPKVDDVVGKETGRIRSLLIRNTELFNLCGLPALSLPISSTGSSIPTALQIVGRHRQDDLVVSIAEKIRAALHSRQRN